MHSGRHARTYPEGHVVHIAHTRLLVVVGAVYSHAFLYAALDREALALKAVEQFVSGKKTCCAVS